MRFRFIWWEHELTYIWCILILLRSFELIILVTMQENYRIAHQTIIHEGQMAKKIYQGF